MMTNNKNDLLKLIDKAAESLRLRHSQGQDKPGIVNRTKCVMPRYYSMDGKWLYMSANGKKPILDPEMAINWSQFWELNDEGELRYKIEIRQWCIFMFGSDDELVKLLGEIGYSQIDDMSSIRKILAWRNELLNNGGIRGNKFQHRVGILFLKKQAHDKVWEIIKENCSKITPFIVNGGPVVHGTPTTNATAEKYVKDALSVWNRTAKNGDKFIILMDGMANRSFSVGEISFAIVTGNDISDSSYDQKTARVRTEWYGCDEKDAFVIDCSLSMNLEFRAEALFNLECDHYLESHPELVGADRDTVIQKMIDEYKSTNTLFKYVLELDKMGHGEKGFAQLFSEMDYLDFTAHRGTDYLVNMFLCQFEETDFKFNPEYDKMNELPKSIVNGIKGTNRITKENENEEDGKDNDKNLGVNTSSDTGKGAQSVKVWWKKLVNSMMHDLVDHLEMCFAYPIKGEDKEKPLPARWASYREDWIAMTTSKYGTQTESNWDMFMSKVKDDARINRIVKTATVKI